MIKKKEKKLMKNKNIFIENVNVKEDKILITVCCDRRQSTTEPKQVYRKNIIDLIPEKYKGFIKIESAPEKPVSNINSSSHTCEGQWVFSIIKKEKNTQIKRRRPRTKK